MRNAARPVACGKTPAVPCLEPRGGVSGDLKLRGPFALLPHHLEHQFGPPSDRSRRPLSRRAQAGRPLSAGDEVPRRQLPQKRVPRHGLSAHRDQRPEGLSRRRDRFAHPLRPILRARLLPEGRRPPSVRPARRRRGGPGSAQLLCAGRRRRARSENQPEVRPQARLRRRDGRMGRRRQGRVRPGDPRRRPQHRAARARRLEPQGARSRWSATRRSRSRS